jgi:RNA polymerase sigma factor for flagellar operon FliA
MSLTKTRAYQDTLARQQRDDLVLEHLDLVKHILGRLAVRLPSSVDVENLEAAGMLGLVEAADRFDPQFETEFRTFAFSRVRGAILDELRRNCPLPQRVLENWHTIQTHFSHVEQFSTEEIAAKTGLTTAEVDECLQSISLTRFTSLGDEIVACRADERLAESPDEQIERREDLSILADCILELPRQPRLVLTLYYLEDLKLREIAEVLSLSESRVCRLVQHAEESLRRLFSRKVAGARLDPPHRGIAPAKSNFDREDDHVA